MHNGTSTARVGGLTLLVTAVVALISASPASAAAALTITPGSDPVAETPVSVSLEGTADAATRLYVFASTGQDYCWSNPADQTGIPVLQGQQVDGPFSTAASFTPPSSGSYRLCGFLDDTPSGTPSATATQTISVRQARASVAIGFSSNPPGAGGGPVQVTVHGSSELARRLWLIAVAVDTSCFPTAGDQTGTRLLADVPVSGSYSQAATLNVQPRQRYTICAYVSKDQMSVPDGRAGATLLESLPPAPPQAPAPVSVSPAGMIAYGPSEFAFVWSYAPGGAPNPAFADTSVSVYAGSPGTGSHIATLSSEPSPPPTLYSRLAPGTYYWNLILHEYFTPGDFNVNERTTTQGPFAFRVVPPELTRLRVRARRSWGHDRRRPGRTVIAVARTPFAATQLTVTRRGKTVARYRFSSKSDAADTRFVYRWSCRRAGLTRYTAVAEDAYGRRRTARGHFNVPTCAAVVARARRLDRQNAARYDLEVAAQRAAQRRITRIWHQIPRAVGGDITNCRAVSIGARIADCDETFSFDDGGSCSDTVRVRFRAGLVRPSFTYDPVQCRAPSST